MANPSVTLVTSRIAQTGAMAIQQRVASGFFFNGTLPLLGGVRAESPVVNGVYKYASLATSGGVLKVGTPWSM